MSFLTDLVPLWALVALPIWAAAVALDERALGLFTLSQPLVAGAIAGLILGDVSTGLVAGLFYQILWPTPITAGGNVPPSGGLGAIVTASVSILSTGGTQVPFGPMQPLVVLGFLAVLLGLIAATSGKLWEEKTRERNRRRESIALRESSIPVGLARAARAARLDSASRGLTIGVAGVVVAIALRLAVGGEPGFFDPVRGWLLPVAIALGTGTLLFRWRPGRSKQAGWLELALGLGIGLVLATGIDLF